MAMSQALRRRCSRIAPPSAIGGQSTRCSQKGGAALSSRSAAANTISAPRIRITKAAGPSPTSSARRSRPQAGQRGATVSRPWSTFPLPQRGQRQASAAATGETAPPSPVTDGIAPSARELRARAAPPVDADEQEQPDHVDEVPVPGCGLEAEVMVRREVPLDGAAEVHREEGGADDHVEAVEAGRHEEGRGIDPVFEGEGGVAVLVGLERGEADSEEHRRGEALDQAGAVVLQKAMVR